MYLLYGESAEQTLYNLRGEVMITALFWILGIIVLGLAGRFVPGFKCISWCRWKQLRAKLYIKRLENITEKKYKHDQYGDGYEYATHVNTDGFSSIQLLRIYKNTAPFGCKSFDRPGWIDTAREILKNRIAEMQILEA